jgi:hypothetical protein
VFPKCAWQSQVSSSVDSGQLHSFGPEVWFVVMSDIGLRARAQYQSILRNHGCKPQKAKLKKVSGYAFLSITTPSIIRTSNHRLTTVKIC